MLTATGWWLWLGLAIRKAMSSAFAIAAGLACLWSVRRLLKAAAHYNSLSVRLDAVLKEREQIEDSFAAHDRQRAAIIKAEVAAIEEAVNAGYSFRSPEAAAAFEAWREMAAALSVDSGQATDG